MLKGRIKGLYLRGEIYWFAKQVHGRRSMVSLETRDYVEAVQRAREIMDAPELQPAQLFRAEVERFLKHKYETNRYSKMSADSKRSCLDLFADSVKNIPPTNVTGYQCKAFHNAAKARIAASTAESYMFTLRSFASICVSKGIDIYRIATWPGDDVRVVQRHYAKLRPDDREIMKAFRV